MKTYIILASVDFLKIFLILYCFTEPSIQRNHIRPEICTIYEFTDMCSLPTGSPRIFETL